MNKANNPPSCVATEPQWREEWVPLSSVIQHGPLQVRRRLDAGAVRNYGDMTKAGKVPPAIKVGRVKGILYLVDGWHRLEAGALVTLQDLSGNTLVKADVAEMSESQVRWEAAKANMGHGVPLKASEYREVFRAFVKAKQHIKKGGEYMSYREMSAIVGKGHTTLRTWALKDHPALAKKLGGVEHGNPEGTPCHGELLSLEEEHEQEALKALGAVVQHVDALASPEVRWGILKELEAAAARLRTAGVQEPQPSDF